jgi:tetratricopeptide (TPR) repeat protein
MRFVFFFLAMAMGVVASAQDFDDAVSPEAQAAAAMRSKRYREAENIYRSMLQRNPESMTSKHLLSHALLMQQKYSESDSLLRVAYLQDSTHPGTYWYFGISSERQDQYDAAYSFFRRYIQKSEQKRLQEFNQSAWLHAGSALRRKMHTQGIDADEWANMVYCYESYMQAQPADPLVPQLRDFVDAVRLKQPRGGQKLLWTEQ